MTNLPRSTTVIKAEAPEAVAFAARALRAGRVVAMPTDTVYGIAAAIDQPAAIHRLYTLKGRPAEKAIPVLLGDATAVGLVAGHIPPLGEGLARNFWPGALTLVVPSIDATPSSLTGMNRHGTRTVAVRVPDCAITRAIIRAAGGALAVTSANVSGREPALTAHDTIDLYSGGPDLVIDGGRVAGGVPSTIIEISGDSLQIIREGAISAAEIHAFADSASAAAESIRHGAV